MELTEALRGALQNLARKQAGQDVDWIVIADARALTELGLAERTREGWRITPAGERELSPPAPSAPREVTPFPPPREAPPEG